MTIRPDLFSGILPFVRAAEERSFGRAAISLGVTTAAVSKAVRKLEEDLDVRLLDRSSRTVALTREGEIFLERCRQAVLGVQGARDAIQDARREPQGEIAVTLPFILGSIVVPGLNALASQYPRLGFRFAMTDRVVRLGDEWHVAIRMGSLSDSSLIAKLLRKTRWVTVASPSYLARRSAPKTPRDLAQHNCLRFLAPTGKPRDFAFTGGSVPTKGNLLLDHGISLLDAAESGLGVAQVLDFMVGDRLRTGAVVEVLSSHSASGPSIHALTTQARSSSPNVRVFIRYLVERFQSI